MNQTHKRIAEITEELRVIYQNDNDGPRLIAEMVEREFPESLKRLVDEDQIDNLKEEIAELEQKLRDARGEIEDANSDIDNLKFEKSELQERVEALENELAGAET